jgi:putative tryptophan/tyrosine transport system substrate-binding protein
MSFRRAGMLGLALLGVVQVADAAAQTTPVMGYVAAKNANPKRLEVFKQGLTELGYVEGRISVLNTEKPSWMRNITA